MIRVAHVLDTRVMGGVETCLVSLLRHRGRHVAATAVLSPDAPDPLRRTLADLGVPIEFHRAPRDKFDVAGLGGLIAGLRRLSPDVVHVHLPYVLDNRYAFLAARAAGVPVVVSTENSASFPSASVGRARMMKRLLAALQDRLIAVAEHVRIGLIRQVGIPDHKVTTIYNGAELPAAASGPAGADVPDRRVGLPDAPLIGMVARLDPRHKRFDDFLVAAGRVRREAPDAHFVAVGDGDPAYAARLQDMARDLGLSQHVHFVGFRDDVAGVLSRLRIAVLATESEGFPLSTLEAMARGVPVVATALPALREQIRDRETGFLIPPRDTDALADRIITLLRDRAWANEMGRRAKQRVERRFSAAGMAGRVEALYYELLSQKRRAGRPEAAAAAVAR